jgi:bifunctional enzyme CysN/CysC
LAERLAALLEAELFEANRRTYYLAMGNLERGTADRDDQVQRLGEMARVLTDAGLLFLSVLSDAEDAEVSVLRALNRPAELFVVRVGPAFGPEGATLVVDPATDVATAARQVLDRLGAEEILLDFVI